MSLSSVQTLAGEINVGYFVSRYADAETRVLNNPWLLANATYWKRNETAGTGELRRCERKRLKLSLVLFIL